MYIFIKVKNKIEKQFQEKVRILEFIRNLFWTFHSFDFFCKPLKFVTGFDISIVQKQDNPFAAMKNFTSSRS
jgi:hypothetical protein